MDDQSSHLSLDHDLNGNMFGSSSGSKTTVSMRVKPSEFLDSSNTTDPKAFEDSMMMDKSRASTSPQVISTDPPQLQEKTDTEYIQSMQIDIVNNQESTLPSTSTKTSPPSGSDKVTTVCAVCGDTGAVSKHYGVMACLGCKGFFRRALKKVDQYECINNDKCNIDQSVRPDRDFTGKHRALRLISPAKKAKTSTSSKASSTKSNDQKGKLKKVDKEEAWKKLPVEIRTMIMNLLNIEIKVCQGDTLKEASKVYPLHIETLKEAIEDPNKLKGKRTEMRYEAYRMAKNEEFQVIAYRRLIAAIDWVNLLDSEMLEGALCIEDKIALIKNCFGPLMLLKNAARTAVATEDKNILCVCNFAYVPRDLTNAYTDTYHLDNSLVGQMLDELVVPLRELRISEIELVCMSAIVVMNPMARDLTEKASEKVFEFRSKIQDALYQYVNEMYADRSPTKRFGNLLLYLPILTTFSVQRVSIKNISKHGDSTKNLVELSLANTVRENLRFAQTFSSFGGIPLLTNLFGCFPVEPFLDSDNKQPRTIPKKSVETQTDDPRDRLKKRVTIRELSQSFTSPAENDERLAGGEFRLLYPPGSYTLIEMFDDRINDNTNAVSTTPHFLSQIPPQILSPNHIYSLHQPHTRPASSNFYSNNNNQLQLPHQNGYFQPTLSTNLHMGYQQMLNNNIQILYPQLAENPYYTTTGYPPVSSAIPTQYYSHQISHPNMEI